MDAPQNTNLDGESLAAELQALSTFAEAKAWGQRAKVELERIAGLMRAADVEIAREAHDLERLKFENAKKSFVGRMFGGVSPEEKELTERIEAHRHRKTQLADAALRLQDLIDFTPTSFEQQKRLLQELRLRKREIQEKKREITTVMRTARPGVPQPADDVFDTDTVSRRKARYERNAKVAPNETMQAATQRQIEQVERDIAWVERFKS